MSILIGYLSYEAKHIKWSGCRGRLFKPDLASHFSWDKISVSSITIYC